MTTVVFGLAAIFFMCSIQAASVPGGREVSCVQWRSDLLRGATDPRQATRPDHSAPGRREDWTMKSHPMLVTVLVVAISLGAIMAVAPGAGPAADTPRRGGVLLAAIAADAPSLDPHQEQTFATIELVAPCYSTLLQIDPYQYPKVIGDAATDWKIAPDGLTYTFKLRPGIRFHDGATLTAADVKATYEKIVFPPEGVRSIRRNSYAA